MNILKYSQPDFYKFSEDSIALANFASIDFVQDNIDLLDLCSGCGVVGLEFILKTSCSISKCDFIEQQSEFKDCLQTNILEFGGSHTFNIHISNFKELTPKKYDLILSNPPYFDSSKNRQGDDLNRNICRFNTNFTFDEYFEFISNSLKDNGICYFVLRENSQELNARYSIEIVDKIKNNIIYKMKKV
jgi:tRNA1Val (adenine37-N6)-methyltransferase